MYIYWRQQVIEEKKERREEKKRRKRKRKLERKTVGREEKLVSKFFSCSAIIV
jgi:hypothetical protein